MKISSKALEHIRLLKQRRGASAAGVRLSLAQGHIRLAWEDDGPRKTDMVLRKNGVPIYIEARAYVRLADYELDLLEADSRRRFLLKHKQLH